MAQRVTETLTPDVVSTVEVAVAADKTVSYTDNLGQTVNKTINNRASGVTVINLSGEDVLYFTVDGSTPTVAGDDMYAVPARAGAALIVNKASESAITVKVISESAVTTQVAIGTTASLSSADADGAFMPSDGAVVEPTDANTSLFDARTNSGQVSDLWFNEHYVSPGVYRRTGYANEKGELRSRAAADNSVAFRTQSYSGSPAANIFEVALSDNTVLVAGGAEFDATAAGFISALNVLPNEVHVTADDTEPTWADGDWWIHPA
jgi:hypothetical protein